MGWATLKLYENKVANNTAKWQQAGKIAINTGTAIGGSISGAIIGQTMIPVPLVGALVGGFLGGLIGSTSSQIVTKVINKQQYIKTMQQLERAMHPEGYWEYTRYNLNIYGITNRYFVQSLPHPLVLSHGAQRAPQIWLTMCTMVVMTVRHSQLEERRRKKLRKLKAQNDLKKQSHKNYSNQEKSMA